jgi:hypothetical protein
MRFFQGAARIERLRRRMVATGQLIDVTEEARQQGLPYTVYLTRRLWTSLVRPYPFAEQDDCVSVARLVSYLKLRLTTAKSDSPSLLLILSPHTPAWFRGPCYLKLFVNRQPEAQASVLVQTHGDLFPFRPRPEEDSLPASLVVRLVETLHNLSLVGRNIERVAIDAMQRIALELGKDGPFHLEMLRYIDDLPPPSSKWLPSESKRAMLLAKLDELLAILAVCANRQAMQQVESLRRHYRVLVSPLAELADLTECLVRIAAEVPNQEGPIRYEPFRPLLNLYVALHSHLKRFETEIPRDALSAIEFHLSWLAKVLPSDLQDALKRIAEELDRLLESRSGQRMVRRQACGNRAVVWH